MPPAKRGARPAARPGRSAQAAREAPQAVEVDAVEINITDLSAHDEATNMLVYGPSGQGKTTLISFAPNATFLSTENPVSAKLAGSKAKLMRTRTWGEVRGAIAKADRTLGPDEWLLVDSITKMQRLHIRSLLEQQHEMNSNRDLDIPALQDHQKWQNQFMRFIDHLYDAPYNVIIAATAMVREDSNGDDEYLPELIGGKAWWSIARYLCAQADVVLYYGISKEVDSNSDPLRYALAQPRPPYTAKDRFSALGKGQFVGHQEYGAMAEWIDMIEGAKEDAAS